MKRVIGIVMIFAVIVPAVLAGDVTPRNRKLADRSGMCMHTIADMRTVQIVLEAYKQDNGKYPKAATMEELRALTEPMYIRTLPLKDVWGTELKYVADENGKNYQLVSAGSDKTFAPETWSSAGLLQSSKDDTVLTADGNDREWVIQR